MSIGRAGPEALLDRGDIYWVQLDPVAGNEQGGRRPALIVSPRAMNAGGTVVIVPLTTRIPPGALPPYKVLIRREGTGLREDSVAHCQQVRAVAKDRLGERREARCTPEQLAAIDVSLHAVLGMDDLED